MKVPDPPPAVVQVSYLIHLWAHLSLLLGCYLFQKRGISVASGQISRLSTLQLISKIGFYDGGRSQSPTLHTCPLSSTFSEESSFRLQAFLPQRTICSFYTSSIVLSTNKDSPGEAWFSAVPTGPASTLPFWVGVHLTLPSA